MRRLDRESIAGREAGGGADGGEEVLEGQGREAHGLGALGLRATGVRCR